MKTFLATKLITFFAAAFLGVPIELFSAQSTISYRYDAAGRLTDVNYGGASRTNYTYDANGNLLSRTNAVGLPELVPGNFNGLVQGTPPGVSNSGFISLKISDAGKFSGKVSVGGKSFSIKGQFDENGAATVTPRGAPFTLALQLDLLGGSEQVTGTFTGGVVGTLLAGKVLFHKKDNPAPASLVGKFTALFQPTSNAAGIPQGNGYGTVNVKSGGTLRLTGKLADGSKIAQGTTLSGSGDWPLFALLYKKKGLVSGTVTFRPLAGSDFSGSLDWVKPATTGAVHPGAFTTELAAIGSRYTAPPKGQRVLTFANSSPNAEVTLSDGNLANPITKPVTLTTANKIEVAAFEPEKLKLSIKVPSGLIRGSFFDSSNTRKIEGVIFQKENIGSGFFLGSSESGLFELSPQP